MDKDQIIWDLRKTVDGLQYEQKILLEKIKQIQKEIEKIKSKKKQILLT